MQIATILTSLRKEKSMTQEQLARALGVSNQAVSKWESGQCCPDISLLPRIADLFGVTIDALFGRETVQTVNHTLPWPDDHTLHAVAYIGHKLVTYNSVASTHTKELTFAYHGPALNVDSQFSVRCESVDGDVDAGTYVECGDVHGDVDAGSHVSCGSVSGDVDAGGSVACGAVGGSIDAGGSVTCGAVCGDVDAGGNVECGDVGGDVDAGGNVTCKSVEGDVDAGNNVCFRP